MPEGHTIHRLAGRAAEAVRRARRPRVQPAGPLRRRRGADRRARAAAHRGVRQAPAAPLHAAGRCCTSISGCTASSDRPRQPPEPVGALRLRLTGNGAWTDLRGATACELITPVERKAAARPARAGPAASRRRPGPGLRAPQPVAGRRRRAADGPAGGRRDRQRLSRRAAVPAPDRPVPAGHRAARGALGAAVGRSRDADALRRAHRADRDGAAPRIGRASVAGSPARRRCTSTGAPASRAGSAAPRSARRCWSVAICSGARTARRRAVAERGYLRMIIRMPAMISTAAVAAAIAGKP